MVSSEGSLRSSEKKELRRTASAPAGRADESMEAERCIEFRDLFDAADMSLVTGPCPIDELESKSVVHRCISSVRADDKMTKTEGGIVSCNHVERQLHVSPTISAEHRKSREGEDENDRTVHWKEE